MRLTTYLTFNGYCETAFKFYEQCLDGKLTAMLTHAGSSMREGTPIGWEDKILHARLQVGGHVLMGSDAPPESYEIPKGFSVSLGVDTPAEAERIFAALAESGSVDMPLQETFWAVRFGMVVDRFGIPWMIDCEKVA